MSRARLLLLAAAAGCAAGPTAGAEAGGDSGGGQGALVGAAPVALSGLRLRLRWAPGSATFADDGARFTTDQGYAVHLAEGYLVSAHATLVPCDGVNSGRSAGWPTPLTPKGGWAPLGLAPLGHGAFDDPSAILTAVAEPLHLHTPEGLLFGASTFERTDYCGAHYLVSTDLNGTGQLPTGPWPPLPTEGEAADTGATGETADTAERWSLRLRGEVRAPDGQTTPLLVEAAGATGELWALSALEGAEGCGERAELTIVRRLDTLLDGLALDQAAPAAIAAGLLVNLIADAEARLGPQGEAR